MTCTDCTACTGTHCRPRPSACTCPSVAVGTRTGSAARRRRRTLALGATLATALLLGGCAPQAADRPQATRTRTPVPTATSRPSAPPVEETAPAPAPPADLERTDVDGAIAAGVHLLALLDHAYTSGDTAPLLALSGPGCGWCLSMADQLGGSTVATRGSSMLVHTPTSVTAQDRGDGTYVVELTADESYLSTREVDGVAVLDLVSAQTYVFAFSVARTATGWQIDGVDLR